MANFSGMDLAAKEKTSTLRWMGVLVSLVWFTIAPIDLLWLPGYGEATGAGLIAKAAADLTLLLLILAFIYSIYRLGIVAEAYISSQEKSSET